jgi:hypothetical protein
MLFTYVDSDNRDNDNKIEQKNILATYSNDDKESYIAAALRHQVPDNELDNRQAKVRDRVTRERTSKIMRICLATDVNTKAPDQQDKATEHLLCTLTLYSDGMLDISPDFSALLEESGNDHIQSSTDQIPVQGMFTSDRTAAIALRKGLRLGILIL